MGRTSEAPSLSAKGLCAGGQRATWGRKMSRRVFRGLMPRWLQTGFLAWLVHRVTGVLLTLYIFVHLYLLSHLRDPLEYERLAGLMETPLVRSGELLLLALVIVHSLNGVRLTLIDLGLSSRLQKPLFWAVLTAGGVLFAFGAWPILGGGG